MNRYDGKLLGCSGWPGLLWKPHPALSAPTTPPSQPLDLQVNSSACSTGSQASHAVGLTQPISNSPRVWEPSLPSPGLASSPKPVPRVWPPLYVTSTNCPKRTWRAPLPKLLTTPWTRHTPSTHIYIYIYIYKEDLALNNLQWLICHKNQPTQYIIYIYIYIYKEDLAFNNLQWLKPNQTKSYIFYIYIYIYIYIKRIWY